MLVIRILYHGSDDLPRADKVTKARSHEYNWTCGCLFLPMPEADEVSCQVGRRFLMLFPEAGFDQKW